MRDLIARLEAAEVGNNTLDDSVVIAAHNGQMMDWYDEEAEQYAIQAEDGSRVNVTPVTTSLDAALALMGRVLPDWDWQITKGADEMALVSIAPTCKVCGPEACAPTPALALCIAILRAKESQA